MTTAINISPIDPETTALDLIVQTADSIGSTAWRAVLQDLAGALQVEGAFVGLAWDEAALGCGDRL